MKSENFTEIKEEFVSNNLTHLDNANSTYCLKTVAESFKNSYTLEDYELVRKKVKQLINAGKESEIVFTSGTTHSINLIANGLCSKWIHRDCVIIPESEPNSNFEVWRFLSERFNFRFETINVIKDGTLDLAHLDEVLESCTGKILFSISHACESIGNVQPVKELFSRIKDYGGITVLDISNTVGKEIIDVQDLDADFACFNGYNIYGPTGVGVLYGLHKKLEKLDALLIGGDLAEFLPHRLEYGEANIQGVVALGHAVDWLLTNDISSMRPKYLMINANFQMMLDQLDFVIPFHPNYYKSGLISFGLKNKFPLDLEENLKNQGIIVRAGFLNSKKIIEEKFVNGIVRVSWAIYTTKTDIEVLENSLKLCYK